MHLLPNRGSLILLFNVCRSRLLYTINIVSLHPLLMVNNESFLLRSLWEPWVPCHLCGRKISGSVEGYHNFIWLHQLVIRRNMLCIIIFIMLTEWKFIRKLSLARWIGKRWCWGTLLSHVWYFTLVKKK